MGSSTRRGTKQRPWLCDVDGERQAFYLGQRVDVRGLGEGKIVGGPRYDRKREHAVPGQDPHGGEGPRVRAVPEGAAMTPLLRGLSYAAVPAVVLWAVIAMAVLS